MHIHFGDEGIVLQLQTSLSPSLDKINGLDLVRSSVQLEFGTETALLDLMDDLC